jgi:hypothetical protein
MNSMILSDEFINRRAENGRRSLDMQQLYIYISIYIYIYIYSIELPYLCTINVFLALTTSWETKKFHLQYKRLHVRAWALKFNFYKSAWNQLRIYWALSTAYYDLKFMGIQSLKFVYWRLQEFSFCFLITEYSIHQDDYQRTFMLYLL